MLFEETTIETGEINLMFLVLITVSDHRKGR